MNRFYRTVFAATLVYLYITLIVTVLTGAAIPLSSFACLYFGLFVFLLPAVSRKLKGFKWLFGVLGTVIALLGFLPILLWASASLPHYIGYGAAFVAAGIFLPLLRHATTRDDFANKFRAAVIITILVIIAIVAGAADNGLFRIKTEYVRTALNELVPVAVMLLASGILLMRGLRAAETIVDEKAFNRRQLRDTLIFAGIVAVVFFLDPFRHLGNVITFIGSKVIGPAIDFIGGLFGRIGKLFVISGQTNDYSHTFEPQQYQDVPVPALPLPPVSKPDDGPPPSMIKDNLEWVSAAFFVVVGVIMLIILIRQILKLRKRRANRGTGYPNEVRENLTEEVSRAKNARLSRRSSDPRVRMRYLYSEFLRYLRRLHVNLRSSDTCSDINTRASRRLFYANKADITEFTELYETARYRMDEAPTNTDAERMKTLLAGIRKSEKK